MVRRVFILCFLAASLAACTVKSVIPPDQALNPEDFAPAIRAHISHGDWLVTRGIHATDNFVATATNMPFSHAAIYDAEKDEVIESESQGVHTTPFAEFVAKSSRVLVIRPMWRTDASAKVAVDRARSWIGKGYDMLSLEERVKRQFKVPTLLWLHDARSLHILLSDLQAREKRQREKEGEIVMQNYGNNKSPNYPKKTPSIASS